MNAVELIQDMAVTKRGFNGLLSDARGSSRYKSLISKDSPHWIVNSDVVKNLESLESEYLTEIVHEGINVDNLLTLLWTKLSNTSKYRDHNYHHYKMVAIKHVFVEPRNIPSNLETYTIIGKRDMLIKDLNKICSDLGWKRYKPTDAAEPDIVLIGDTISEVDMETYLGHFKSGRVVSLDDMERELHFLNIKGDSVDEVSQEIVATYLDAVSEDSFTMVCQLIQYLNKNVLSDSNRIRLVRTLVQLRAQGFEDPVWMSNVVRAYCHRQHMYQVTHFFRDRVFSSHQVSKNTDTGNYTLNYSSNAGMNSMIYMASPGFIDLVKEDINNSGFFDPIKMRFRCNSWGDGYLSRDKSYIDVEPKTEAFTIKSIRSQMVTSNFYIKLAYAVDQPYFKVEVGYVKGNPLIEFSKWVLIQVQKLEDYLRDTYGNELRSKIIEDPKSILRDANSWIYENNPHKEDWLSASFSKKFLESI